MLLKFGIDVETHNGKKVGELKSVIIDPASDEITHLIVRKGFLLSQDKLVPISLAANSDEDRIQLHEFEGSFEDLQDYQETLFIPVENYINDQVKGDIIPLLFYAPLTNSQAENTQLTSVPVVRENLPTDRETLEEGMEIFSLTGEKVGVVEEIILHPTTDQITHLLIAEGLLFKSKALIPASWIKEISGSEIHLFVDKKVIENLPTYREEGIIA